MTKYGTILADPPWPESGGGQIKRGADRHYPLMTVKAIAALPVQYLASYNSHLYLWATNNYLPHAFAVMKAWDFTYITTITWVKTGNPGLGQYYRGMTEHCLFGRRGMPPYKVLDGKRQQGRTAIETVGESPYFDDCVIRAARGKHSQKPEQLRTMIERVSYGPFLELFAREPVVGWDRWGNEVESTVQL